MIELIKQALAVAGYDVEPTVDALRECFADYVDSGAWENLPHAIISRVRCQFAHPVQHAFMRMPDRRRVLLDMGHLVRLLRHLDETAPEHLAECANWDHHTHPMPSRAIRVMAWFMMP